MLLSLVLALALPAHAAHLSNSAAYSSGELGAAPYQTFWSSDSTPPKPNPSVLFNFIEYPPKDDGHIFLAPRVPGRKSGAAIFDYTGELVWDGAEFGAGGFAPWTYKGKPVLSVANGQSFSGGYSAGDGVLLDQSYNVIANISTPLPGLKIDFHEIAITKEDTALVTIYGKEAADLTSVGGPKDGYLLAGYAQEINLDTGEAVWTWKSTDHVPLSHSYATVKNSGAGTEDKPFDYFHINSVTKDEQGNFLISSRHTGTIFYLSGRDGSILWRLGGKNSTYALGEGVKFSWQHHARFHSDNTLSLFDNAASGWAADEATSRGLLLRLEGGVASLVTQALPSNQTVSRSQGNFERIESGWVGGWGQVPYVSGYDEDGTRSWSAQFGPLLGKGQVTNYRAYQQRWVGYPTTKPSVVVNATHGAVSWNGATEVVEWEVVVGGEGGRKVRKEGFETVFEVEGGKGVQVRGVGGDGRALGESEVVTVGGGSLIEIV